MSEVIEAQVKMIETRVFCLSTDTLDIQFRYKPENASRFSIMINKGDWRAFDDTNDIHRFLDGVYETCKALGV